MKEIKLAFGSRNARRSTVWKFLVTRNDAYVLTRMLGTDVKLSLHESGDCQWSGTSAWVKDGSRKNAERHFVRWSLPEAVAGNDTTPVAQVVVPETQLRRFAGEEDLRGVHWIPAPPPAGEAFAVACSFFPPSADEPRPELEPYKHIASLPLADGRWFVLRLTQVQASAVDIEKARSEMITKLPADFHLDADHRVIFVTRGLGLAWNLVEVAALR
ncbi:MAG TPA: hypothetical protein VHC69_33810 [Polyangiaceae bacterium]|nr:hypothetical protein [Polyangiaceae bacterium]